MRTEIFPMRSMLDTLFNDSWDRMSNRNEAWIPQANIRETPEAWMVDLSVPGYRKDAFKIEVKESVLSVRAEVEKSSEKETEKYNYREFTMRSFNRKFNLPKGKVDEDKIEAHYENGILRLTIPKLEEAKVKSPRLIEIL